jgi:formylmethanofuran dehydrogenase subunit E
MPCDGPSTPAKPGVIFCSECGEPMSHGTAKTEAGQPVHEECYLCKLRKEQREKPPIE